jgi:hypothetical protein
MMTLITANGVLNGVPSKNEPRPCENVVRTPQAKESVSFFLEVPVDGLDGRISGSKNQPYRKFLTKIYLGIFREEWPVGH